MNRRELFGSLTSGLKNDKPHKSAEVLRPPYNKDDSLFLQECHKCEAKCADICEENIIKIAEDATPYLSFDMSGCTFCDECASVCEFGVLELENRDNINANIDISVSACISWHDVMCFSCKDPCLENAIVFQGLFKPVIDMSKCTACGFCISRCPVSAIEVEFKQ
ncbi:ferredoxin-type protein NapF [Sulfurimonas sp. SAG-AH-194-C21]|nr:ferredoxin-type protein NapF [Sulfurimonas sp. SAG-AH-194-C21]MDF1882727.1 ferredoxin-type protein NapF [Sulfurimonas sp. SAG-AH-194-C21]